MFVGGQTLLEITPEHLEDRIQYWLTAYYPQPPSIPALTTQSMDRGAVRVDSTSNSEWIYHSQGAPFTSDESKVYIQSGEKSRRDWRIRNNYFELPFKPSPTYPNQSFVDFTGNGSGDKDYHLLDNLGRFTGARVTTAGLPLGTASLAFGTSTSARDTILERDGAANTLALRNGTSAQTFRLYETYSSALRGWVLGRRRDARHSMTRLVASTHSFQQSDCGNRIDALLKKEAQPLPVALVQRRNATVIWLVEVLACDRT